MFVVVAALAEKTKTGFAGKHTFSDFEFFKKNLVCISLVQFSFSLAAKPVVVFLARATNNKQLNGLRAHISEILGAVGVHISSGGSAHFVIGFAGK